ncbi:anthranilate synthase component 1 [Clostridium acetobutylicum]|uniref:Anthranilate synthase component 1 n=1 Tax=Clostridium acetobutylicum (strain ATCC 824 / DSM 792 / JCM 1419 / IAM 19013 / LMG 5710 / NBRC 13948 / NRRL B-527 / VKM B-1787 / 2291 / W) TaxID=272562 RepID=Q97EF0_CLOAB|nr:MULTISPECIES: anthranilate synthase component I [Clostridium]AAK81100.1 Para-aminobenzoate synthase component I [Clostridium acetobutylicum ATCC 824]ADZ22204.1 anthranilate synthase component I [Clostridium acetobutylicum EA 2018]AEI33602.1 anthranilate synthase component I [Clostridium acetobutylicum DSM 1731]AWV82076.1 anthranilate synthase component I [Clostridium acetobutylicum]MBC2393347.1 anthranilate synthase component I [Clostridium acetobutylicum]
MYNISEEQFNDNKKLKKAFQVIYEENGDEITPISLFYNLEGKNKFLLESNLFSESKGRYSFIGANPYAIIKGFSNNTEIIRNGYVKKVEDKFLKVARKLTEEGKIEKSKYPFCGGGVGYVGYDIIKQYEKIPSLNEDDLKIPDAILMFYKKIICYDHVKNSIVYIYNVFREDDKSYKEIKQELFELSEISKKTREMHKLPESHNPANISSNFTKDEFCKMVKKAQEYIVKGDIFQMVPSQRFVMDIDERPFNVYRRLRGKNPSPYLFYIDFNDFQVTGSSPESLVCVFKDRVITNPIAGTRPRGKNEQEDIKLKSELINDEKEIAEHSMLLDLARNDIGKISEFGTVTVDKFMEVELYSHVMHIVSKVSGRLKKEYDCFEALKSCLPAGTVSGAPKIRAMEIIDELENTKRGCYAGAVGYFSYDGNMDTCIAIRTLVIKEGKAYAQAGGGVVYDSIPENEYEESMNKSQILKEVI